MTEQSPTFNQWQDADIDTSFRVVEAQQWPQPGSIDHILQAIKEDEWGIKRLDTIQLSSLEGFFKSLDVITDAPDEQRIKDGVKIARKTVDQDASHNKLATLPFMTEIERKRIVEGAPKSVLAWNAAEPLNIKPGSVVGGRGLANWAGDELGGGISYKREGVPSLAAINDYATRETQLPAYEAFALQAFLTNEGAFFFAATDVHRTAAAKLRDEPLRFSSLVVFDARK